MNPIITRSLKILLRIVIGIILFLLLVLFSLNLPFVQNFIKDRVIIYLKNKTNTEISLKSLRIGFPRDLQLNKFYIEDKKKDTLLYADKLLVDLDMIALFSNKVEIQNIELSKVTANVNRLHPDTVFNYQFLIDSLTSNDKKTPQKESSSTLTFDLNTLKLDDIRIRFKDDVAGNDASISLGTLDTKIKLFNLDRQHFFLDRLNISHTHLAYNQYKPLTVLQQVTDAAIDNSERTKGKLPLIEFSSLLFDDVHLNYDDKLSDTRAAVVLNELNFTKLLVDLTNGKYKASNTHLANSMIDVAYRPITTNEKAIQTATDSVQQSPFSLYLDDLSLSNNKIKYQNLSAPKLTGKFDYNHLNIHDFTIAATDIAIDSTNIKAQIKNGKLTDSSGFSLHRLEGNLVFNDNGIKIDNLFIETPTTKIDNSTVINYRIQKDLTQNPQRVQVNTNFRNTIIGGQDLYYLLPNYPSSYRNQKVYFTSSINGYLNNLNILKLSIKGLQSTHLDISGTIKGFPNFNKARFNIDIKNLSTSKKDLQAFIPKESFPSSIEIPNYLITKGNFNGSLHNFTTNLKVQTDMGNADVIAQLDRSKRIEHYSAKVNLKKFNAGKLLKRRDIGIVSLDATLNGTGLTPNTMNTSIVANIRQAYYNGYNYQNIAIDAKYKNQTASVYAVSKDANALLTLSTTIGLAGKSPSINGYIDLKHVDLQKLNFVKDELKLAGIANLDFTNITPDYLNGSAFVTSMQVVNNGQRLDVDTISFIATSNRDSNSLHLNSEIFSAHLAGKYQLTKLGQAFINELNKYYKIGTSTKLSPQSVDFSLQVYNSDLLKKFVPKLNDFATASIYGSLHTQRDSLLLHANFPHVLYDSFSVKGATLNINNQQESRLAYGLHINSFESPSIKLYNSEINGQAKNNQLGVNVFLRDSKNRDKYTIGGLFSYLSSNYRFNLNPNQLILNYDAWQVHPDNLLQYGKKGIYIRDFEIAHENQSLSINSIADTTNSPIKAIFKDFLLETLTRYAEQDTSLLGGIVNGNILAKDITVSPKFEADLTIAKLRFKKDQLGDAAIAINNYTSNAFETDIALTGIHDISVKGFYYTAPTSSIDATISIHKIDLSQVESLSGGQIRNGSGFLSGNIIATGALSAPQLIGQLTFNNAAMNIAMLNAYYRIDDQTISLQQNGIAFNRFTIIDSLGQRAIINGLIATANYKDFSFNLNVNARNFRVMNSTSIDNELFYGKLYLNLNANITGDVDRPIVDFTANINRDTKFNFVIPESNPAVIEQEGIVEFVDMNAPPNNGRAALNVDSMTTSRIKGLEVSGNISIDKNAELNIIVDPSNGDALTVKGNGDLSFQMDASGKITLTGRYELSDGGYNLTIGGLARRQFKIQQGSYLVWTGSPTEANVNITAIYETNTSAIDLVADQIQNYDNFTRTTLRQKLPFFVYLKMTGELLKPQIRFEIGMPENEQNAFNGIVYTRLQQVNANESDLNKQVFALLALNRFIADNPFESLAGGTTVTSMARQSVSKLLTEQLNNLAADLIKGIDINFELTSGNDYSTGQQEARTDLNISFSKRLLNDRLFITVGNNFTLEGPRAGSKQSSNIAGNVNIEYFLSKDGRYRLRAYRRNQSEGIIEGEIIETGLGFAMVVEYNRFRQLFNSFKKNERKRKSNSQ